MDTELTIRPARPDDRPAMERICAQTWDWGDYIPDVWDDWLAEAGVVIVGELTGRVVALSKITWQTHDQAWLEGMRVDPDYRQRGIAGQFLVYALAYAREHGARVVRLGTSHRNTPVHILVARNGMERVGSCVLWIADPLSGDRPDSGPSLLFLTPEHTAQVRAFLAVSPVLAHTHGLYSVDWAWQELSAVRVGQFLEEGQVVAQVARDGQMVALATIHADPEDKQLWMGFADGEAAAVTGLAIALRIYAAQLGVEKVSVMVPDLAWLRDALRAAGYGSGDWEGELLVFERWLEQSGVSSGGNDDS